MKFVFSGKLVFILSLIFLWSSLFYALNYGFHFRHSGVRLSSVSRIFIIMLLLKIYFSGFVLFLLSRFSYSVKETQIERCTLVVIFLATIVSVEGAFDIAKVAVIGLMLLKTFLRLDFLFSKSVVSGHVKKCLNITMLFFSGFFALFVGIANKRGVSETIDFFLDGNILDFVILPLRRVSYHLYSLSYHINYSLFDSYFEWRSIVNIFGKIINRASIFLGGEGVYSAAQTVGRINSVSVYQFPKPWNGVSPGWSAGFFFFPPFPINILFWILITVVVLRIFSDIFSGNKKPSFFVVLYCIIFFQAILDTSIEFINPLTKQFLYTLILVLVWLSVDRNHYKVELA